MGANLPSTVPPSETHNRITNGQKVLLEGRLIVGSFADKHILEGACDSLKETFSWRGLEEIATGLAVGGGIAKLIESKRGRVAGLVLSAGLVGTFVTSSLAKIYSLGADTWQHPDHLNADQGELANFYGKTVTDAVKSIATGYGVGAAYGRYSTVVSRKVLENQFAPKITDFHLGSIESIPGVTRVEKFFAPGWAKNATRAGDAGVSFSRGNGSEVFSFAQSANNSARTTSLQGLKQIYFDKDKTVIDEISGRRVTIEKSGRKTIEEADGGTRVVNPSTIFFSPTIFAQSEIGQRLKDAAIDLGYSQWFHQIVGHPDAIIEPEKNGKPKPALKEHPHG
jgi:hypothetical protein